MIQSTQRKMLRLIIRLNKRIYKKIEKQDIEPKDENRKVDITDMCSADDESGDGQSTKTHDDVDSEVTFEDDADEEMDTTAIEEEDWMDYIKRSTVDAMDKMERAKIRCWNRTHKKMKWKLALRIATSPSERWLKKAAEWNPDWKTEKRWEDDINDFLKQEFEENEKENPIERSNQTNKNWINIAKEWRRNLHNDRVKKTEVKMKTTSPSKKSREDETMTLSKAAASQPRSALQAATWSIWKQQQNSC